MANPILEKLGKIFAEPDEKGLIIADTIMLACGLSPEEVNIVGDHGLSAMPDLINSKIKAGELTDANFIGNLFSLEQEALDQLPISFYADLVSSQSFKDFNKDRQNEIFGRVFRTIGVESFEQLEQLEPEKVAYNHEALKTIFGTYFAVNKKNNEQEKAATELLNTTISNKLQAMVDLAPALSEDPEKRATMTNLSARHKGDLSAASEEVLGLFADTKPLTKANLTAMGLNQNFEQHSVATAKAVLAQYKLGAYAEAAKALGIVSEENAAKYSVVNPEEKQNPVNRYVNAAKTALANFAKPQNLAKLGFRQVAIRAITHFTEGAVPGIGAGVGLAMKLAECGKKIFKDKQKASEVFKDAASDLVRGTVTLGLSFTPLGPIAAGPIGTVAGIATKGIQAAHQEGLKIGHGFFKRVAEEFKKKGNVVNLAASVAGAAVGVAGREIHEHMKAAGVAGAVAGAEEENLINEETPVNEIESGYAQYQQHLHNQDDMMQKIDPVGNGNGYIVDEDGVLHGADEVEQYLAQTPGAHLDKNGWVQNADGSYARNAQGQLFGSEDRVFRDLQANETLDQHGNIVNATQNTVATEIDPLKVSNVADNRFNETTEVPQDESFENLGYQKIDENAWELKNGNQTTVVTNAWTEDKVVDAPNMEAETLNDAVVENDSEPTYEKEDLAKLTDEELYARMDELAKVDTSKMNPTEQKAIIEKQVEQLEELKNRQAESNARLSENEKTLKELTDEVERSQEEIEESQKNIEQLDEEIEKLNRLERVQAERDKLQTKLDEVHARQKELGVLQEPVLTVRSAEELAEIDKLQAVADKARAFNSLPESQQKELIDLQAQMKVAENRGDLTAHEDFKRAFNEKFNQYVQEDEKLDHVSKQANLEGTQEYMQRQHQEDMIKSNGTFRGGKEWTEEEREAAIKKFTEKYGDDMGNGENGIRQYVRHDGNLKMEIPDVPAKNFLELGYQKQADGTWLYRDEFTTKIVTDVNHNGIPDAGDTYEKTVEIGKPGTSFYSKKCSSGKYVEPAREQINPSYNAKVALEERIKHFEKVMGIAKDNEQGRTMQYDAD